MHAVGLTLYWVLTLYWFVLIGRVVLSYVPLFKPDWRPTGKVAVLTDGVYRLTDPVIRPLDRAIPPVRLGTVLIPLGIIIVFVLVGVLRSVALSL